MCKFKDLLGTMSDSQLAQKIGVSREYVRQCRNKFNIPKYGKFKWTDESISLLGKSSDTDVAKKLKIEIYTVSKKRKELGIPKYPWSNEALQLLGTDSDPNIAKKLNISVGSVFNKRKELGIPQYQESHNRWNPYIEWNEELNNLLGKCPDTEIAKKLGIPHNVVYNRRLKLGIPKFSKRNR